MKNFWQCWKVNKRVDKIMRNFEISSILTEIADMLEIRGDSYYKVMAYRKAARAISNLRVELKDFIKEHSLEEIDAIGKAISEKITEIIATGSCRYYEDLKKKCPRVLVEMLKIPGFGAKKIKVIYDALKVSSIEELERAARAHLIRVLPGMGAKTELLILRGIKMLKEGIGNLTLSQALIIANDVILKLKSMAEVKEVECVGSLRRRKEIIDDIDLLVASDSKTEVIDGFARFPRITEVIYKDQKRIIAKHDLGIKIDLRVVDPACYIMSIHKYTGCMEHVKNMYSLAKETGHDLSSAAKTLNNEAEIYKSIGIPYIIPELRENRGEISAAIDSRLPDVVELDDIKGDVHVHSNWSDGAHSIESIAKYAMSLGYEYIAITDHSKSLKIAQGLDEQRLLLQIELIKKTNSNLENFRILTGIEVDILSDELDFNDDVLSKLDIVIASIHTGFRQERAKITNRILSACENPHVDIIAHPTGRILGRRDPYDVDIDAIIDKAAETGTALEINSSPDRLDLNDIMAKKAKDKGVKITIGTDAHEKEGLKDINFGVWVARRGWLEKGDVLNTMPFDEMYEWLKTN